MTSRNLPISAQKAQLVPAVRRTSYLSQSIHLEESRSPRLIRFLILVLTLAVVGAIVWASFARLDQVARADGTVVPSSSVFVLEHLEGGLIEEVLVRTGEIVEAGQVVMRLSAASAGSELRQLKNREASLSLRLERLTAQVEKRDGDFGRFEATYPGLAREQITLLTAIQETRRTQMQLFQEQLADQNIQLETLQSQRGTITDSIALIEEEARLRKELLDKGLTRRFTYLDVLRDLNRTRGQLVQLDGLIARAYQEIAEIETRRITFDSTQTTQALNEISQISAELGEVRESIARFEDKFGRLEIKSPVRGIIQDLGSTISGGVVSPGAAVAEIVPIDEDLVVEVKVNPRDIAFVSIGQKASVRVSAFDFARFGAMDGTVAKISPTTVASDNGAPFYKVTISLLQPHFGRDPEDNLILPGMVVQADIRTDDRTVLDYIAKPITRALAVGFTER